MTPIASSTPALGARPIGTCDGLNSPWSPRMVTSISSGNWFEAESESMLMQCPRRCLHQEQRLLAAEPRAAEQRNALPRW